MEEETEAKTLSTPIYQERKERQPNTLRIIPLDFQTRHSGEENRNTKRRWEAAETAGMVLPLPKHPELYDAVVRNNPRLIGISDYIPSVTEDTDMIYSLPALPAELGKEIGYPYFVIGAEIVPWSMIEDKDLSMIFRRTLTQEAPDFEDPQRRKWSTKRYSLYEKGKLVGTTLLVGTALYQISPDVVDALAAYGIVSVIKGGLSAKASVTAQKLVWSHIKQRAKPTIQRATRRIIDRVPPDLRANLRYAFNKITNPFEKTGDSSLYQAVRELKIRDVQNALIQQDALPDDRTTAVYLIPHHEKEAKPRWNKPDAQMRVVTDHLHRVITNFQKLYPERITPETVSLLQDGLYFYLGSVSVRKVDTGFPQHVFVDSLKYNIPQVPLFSEDGPQIAPTIQSLIDQTLRERFPTQRATWNKNQKSPENT